MKPLGEIIKILKGGKAPEVFDEPRPGAYPYLQIEDLRPDATPKYALDKDGTLATKADVLIAWDGANAGTVGFNLEGYIGSTIAILRPINDDIHAPYLGYFLRSKFNEIQENTTGATIPHVNRAFLERLQLPLPPLPEQRRIADLLSRADRLRHLRRVGDSLSASLLQSVFLEMFGDGHIFDKVEFEEILDEDLKNGLYLSSDYYGSGTPIIRIDAFYNGVLGNPANFKRLRATQNQIEEFKVQNDEILINRVNSLEYLGKCALVEGLTETTLFESNMIRIRVNRKIANPIYVTKFLTTQQAYAQIMQKAKKAVNQASINQQDVKSIIIPVPSLPQQEQFAMVVRRVESLRGRQSESARQADGLFQSLLSQSFGGAT